MAAPAGSNGHSLDEEAPSLAPREASVGCTALTGREKEVGEDSSDSEVAATTDGADQGGDAVVLRRPTLPTELIDHVITYIPETDKATLAALCLASRTFSTLARPRLYRTLPFRLHVWLDGMAADAVGPATLSPSYHSFYERILLRDLDLHLVKTVVIKTRAHDDFRDVAATWGRSDKEYDAKLGQCQVDQIEKRWLSTRSARLAAFLERLPNLEKIIISPPSGDRWTRQTSGAVHLLAEYLSDVYLPSVTTLQTPVVPSPNVLSASFPRLSHLSCTFQVGGQQRHIYPADAALCHLLLREPEPLGLRAGHLRTFVCLTSGARRTLKVLDMSFGTLFHPALTSFVALRHLTLRLERVSALWTSHSLLASLTTLPQSLDSLTVYAEEQEHGPVQRVSDTFLSSLPRNLKRLSLSHIVFSSRIIVEAVGRKEECFPALQELSIEWESGTQWTSKEEDAVRKVCGRNGVVFTC
ncbi:hypothetical protein JCM10213_003823 [Rhodosporidiobolus nylandii]